MPYALTIGSTLYAQAYSENAYNEGRYSCTSEQRANGICYGATATIDQTTGSLINTGVAIVAGVTFACLIVFIALVLRIRKKPKKHTGE